MSSLTATRKSNSSCRLSGGISLLFKKEFENFTINDTILDSTKDLLICGVYRPPRRSRYFEEEIFDDLENDVVYFSKKGNVVLVGYFNARTAVPANLKILSQKKETPS